MMSFCHMRQVAIWQFAIVGSPYDGELRLCRNACARHNAQAHIANLT